MAHVLSLLSVLSVPYAVDRQVHGRWLGQGFCYSQVLCRADLACVACCWQAWLRSTPLAWPLLMLLSRAHEN